MKFLNRTDTESVFADFTGDAVHLESVEGYSIAASWTDTTPVDGDTFVSGVLEIQTLTFPAKAAITDRDYIVIYNQAGTSFAVYADKTGTSVAPTGAAYVAASFKVKANISADATAAQVAARFKTAFNTLTGFTASVTLDDSAADGTMLSTQVTRGPTTNPVPHNLNDSGAGTLAGVQTTGGVASDVDLTANSAVVDDNIYSGLKIRLTTDGTLPTGLSTGVDYYAINVDTTTIKFATSRANALLGTAIDITGFGSGTHTIDVREALAGTLKLQASNNAFLDNTNNGEDPAAVWVDIPGSSVTVAAAGTQIWNVSDVYYKSVRQVYTSTSGNGVYTSYVYAKGPY